MKPRLSSLAIAAAALALGVVVPAPAAESAAANQEREQVRQTEQEVTTTRQRARWQEALRRYDRNGDGQLAPAEKQAALEAVRLRNQEELRQAAAGAETEAKNTVREQAEVREEQRSQEAAGEAERRQAVQEQRWRQWLERFDENKDGQMSDEEFSKALTLTEKEAAGDRDKLRAKDKTKLKDQDQTRDQDRIQDQDQDKDQLQDQDRLRDQDRLQVDRPGGGRSQRGGGRRR